MEKAATSQIAIDEGAQFREWLSNELQSRMRRNPAYSLRSFARDLGLAPSGISRLLSGQRGLSPLKARHVAHKLDLASGEASRFCLLAEAAYGRSQSQRNHAKERLDTGTDQVNELSLEYFKMVSDWQHFAILELINLKDFKSDPSWIAERLGLTEEVVSASIETLLRLELLDKTVGNKLKKKAILHTTPTGVPSRAIRSYHQQILKKAECALFEQPVQERDFSGIHIALDPKEMDWARNEIQKFRRTLASKLSRSKNKKRLYHLSVQFFALDQERKIK